MCSQPGPGLCWRAFGDPSRSVSWDPLMKRRLVPSKLCWVSSILSQNISGPLQNLFAVHALYARTVADSGANESAGPFLSTLLV